MQSPSAPHGAVPENRVSRKGQDSFHVLVLHESVQMRGVAQTLLERLCGRIARAVRVKARFQAISAATTLCQEAALDEAIDADMIIVAVRGRHKLPRHATVWLTEVILRRDERLGALVALFDVESSVRSVTASGVQADLQRLALDGRLTFFTNLPQMSSGGVAAETQRARSEAAVPGGSLNSERRPIATQSSQRPRPCTRGNWLRAHRRCPPG